MLLPMQRRDRSRLAGRILLVRCGSRKVRTLFRRVAAKSLLSAMGVSVGVPLPGSQCGAGDGRTIARTPTTMSVVSQSVTS